MAPSLPRPPPFSSRSIVASSHSQQAVTPTPRASGSPHENLPGTGGGPRFRQAPAPVAGTGFIAGPGTNEVRCQRLGVVRSTGVQTSLRTTVRKPSTFSAPAISSLLSTASMRFMSGAFSDAALSAYASTVT